MLDSASYYEKAHLAETVVPGYLHAAFGTGGLLGPLVATAFVQAGIKFSRFFGVSLALVAVNGVVLFYSFIYKQPYVRPKRTKPPQSVSENREGHAMDNLQADRDGEAVSSSDLGTSASAALEGSTGGDGQYYDPNISAAEKDRLVIRNKTVWFAALFLLVYVGCEVSIGGWIVTYLREVRDANVSAGYVS